MEDSTSEPQGSQLQIKFFTKQKQYSIPDTPFAVPFTSNVNDLNALLNELIKESSDVEENIVFDFIAVNELIRSKLCDHIADRGVSSENVIEIEYFEKLPSPEPEDCLLHDDWVSAVDVLGKWILTGCYDNTVHIWTLKGKHKLTMPGHNGAVKGVKWVAQNDSVASFVSVSQDQTAMVWEWNMSNNSVDCIHVCRGHERSIECVSVNPGREKFATGSWDSLLKIWSSSSHRESDSTLEVKRKKAKNDNISHTRTPLLTLKGHKEAISSVNWMTEGRIVTGSWDHTIKIWDVEYGAINQEIVGNKSFLELDASPINYYLITTSADRHVRMYDPRANESSIVVKTTFTSHTQWVQTVRWSKTDERLFVSGGYDSQFKLWDTRNCKIPLFDLLGHEDKILCCDWSNPKYLMSGGADNTLRIFKAKNYDVSTKMETD